MLPKILAALKLDNPASLRRFVVLALGGLVVIVSPYAEKFGLPVPSETTIEVFAAIIVTYLLQSGMTSAAEAKAEGVKAAALVDTTAKADDVLKAAAKEEVK